VEKVKNDALSTYRDLRAWQEAIKLVEAVYKVTQAFPQEERFGLCAQMQRAAVSVPSNIAEGYGREHRKEYLQHLSIARASLMELETHIIIVDKLGYVSHDDFKDLWEQAQVAGRILRGLTQSLGGRSGSSKPQTPNPKPETRGCITWLQGRHWLGGRLIP